MKKKIISFLIGLIILLTTPLNSMVYANSIDRYINGSSSSNVSLGKITTYFNNKKANSMSDIFCVNRDSITYYESFYDDERDYYSLPFSKHMTSNNKLTEDEKQINPLNLKMMYVHDPNYYDNPVSKSNLSGKKYPINVKWNSESNRWMLENKGNSSLFNTTSDDKRGLWTIYLYGFDSTGKPVFDKETTGFKSFRIHKAPTPKFKVSENNNLLFFKDNGSYDYDYMYSKNAKYNRENDRQYNGIKEFYWSVKANGKWQDMGKGISAQFSKAGNDITDYMLTVEDYDGAKTSISKSQLILEKPIADFEYLAGHNHTTYFYEGNKGHETVQINPLITWNDEAYDSSIYNFGGTRTESWTALNTMDNKNTINDFTNQILKNKYYSIVKNNMLPVELTAKNKFDIFDTISKNAEIIKLSTIDSTGTIGTTACILCQPASQPKMPYLVGSSAQIIYDVTNTAVDKDELKIVLNAPQVGINNKELLLDNNNFTQTIPLLNPSTYNITWWDKFNYTFNIYSKRTNELLNEDKGQVIIHTPMSVDGYINGEKNSEVNNDDVIKITATTPKYAEFVTIKLPVKTLINGKSIPAETPINLTPDASHTSWSKDIYIEDAVDTDKKISILFEATAYNKRDKATDSINATIISYRLLNFRVTKVRDFSLEGYYKSNNTYNNIEMNVNSMAIDASSFSPYPIQFLTKGYMFEFKIDSINFNNTADKIIITPSLYAVSGNYRYPTSKNGYWIDSSKKVWQIGTGGHQSYQSIILTKDNRSIINSTSATWQGKYLIPGSTFLTESNTTIDNALNNKLNVDIIVNFNIVGYKDNVPKFNYNIKQWGKERTISKVPYEIGDVIRYNGEKSNLNDLNVIRPRG